MSIESVQSPFPDDPARREELRRIDDEWERGLERFRVVTMFGSRVLPGFGWSTFAVVFGVLAGAVVTVDAFVTLRRFNEDGVSALIPLFLLPLILGMVLVSIYHFYMACTYRAARAAHQRRRDAVLRGSAGLSK